MINAIIWALCTAVWAANGLVIWKCYRETISIVTKEQLEKAFRESGRDFEGWTHFVVRTRAAYRDLALSGYVMLLTLLVYEFLNSLGLSGGYMLLAILILIAAAIVYNVLSYKIRMDPKVECPNACGFMKLIQGKFHCEKCGYKIDSYDIIRKR